MSSLAIRKLKEWRDNPVQFVRECFQVEPDPWQVDALMAFAKDQRIAMKSSKGPGKTATLSWCAWNFLATRPHPKMAATSITKDNLTDNLWPEMAKWQKKCKFLNDMFVWTKTRIFAKDHPETWWMSARTWPKSADSTQQADTLAGLHADYLMFIIDEVGGIPDAVMAAAEAGLATGVETKIIMAGNPTHLEGPLYRACTQERHLWSVIEITSDPDDPKRSPRVSTKWAKEQIEKYGRDNPWVLVNVFGKFPPSSINTLIGPDAVRAAMTRGYAADVFSWAQKRLGIDVARYGDDRTVIFPRQGLVASRPDTMRHTRDSAVSVDIANRVMAARKDWGSEIEFIDTTGGWGKGCYDVLLAGGASPISVEFHLKAIDPRYKNKRSEMWDQMCKWILDGGAIPNIPELVPELTVPTYCYVNGQMLIEPKDQIKDRLGYSPDLADALALTFAMPELPKRDAIEQRLFGESSGSGAGYKSDYDPYAEDRINS